MTGPRLLSEPISGTSSFAEEFEQRGPFDAKQRSLRQFELEMTLFRYPCSYLIYSETFDMLPEPLLALIYERLLEVFESKDSREKYAHLSLGQRSAILQILRETKPNLPSAWSDK